MVPHHPINPWSISPDDFPVDGYASDQLEFLLGYAVLAPSNHNTQPWLFRINAMDVEVVADRRRALPVVDPDGRELTMSCGAALYNLRIAAEYFGHQYRVEPFPGPADANVVARMHLGLGAETSSEDVLLFQSITRRHTNRQTFRPEAVPEAVLAALADVAQREGVTFQVATGSELRDAVVDHVAEGDRRQWADKRFREELARWVRPHPEQHTDGIAVHDLGVKDWLSFAGPALIRTFDRGSGQAARDRDIALHSPVLAVLWTPDDTPQDWLRAGQALQGVLLRARGEDVWASFLNQPIEVPELRSNLAAALGINGYIQILLRLGYGPEITPTPRRSPREMLIKHKAAH